MLKRAGKIGFVLLSAPGQPSQERIRKVAEDSKKYIQKREGIELFCLDEPVVSIDDAARAASLFKRSDVDAIVIQHGAASPAKLSLRLVHDMNLPIALWGVPEGPLDNTSSLCGSMTGLLAHSAALTSIDKKYAFVHGLADSEEARKSLDKFLRTAVVRNSLRRARIALVGYTAESLSGFDFDEMTLNRRFGIDIEHIGLSEIIENIRQVSDEEIEADIQELRSTEADVQVTDQAALRRSSAAYLALRKLMIRAQFSGTAVKCRPELIDNNRIGMSAACSRLADAGFSVATEGDIDAAVTALIQQALTARPTFVGDWVQRDDKINQVLFWHDGTAPVSLANPRYPVQMTDGLRIKENVLFDFPLKTGDVTVARLTSQGGRCRMFIAPGRAVEPTQTIRGTHVSVKFEAPVLNLLMSLLAHGFPQHYSIVYEDVHEEMIELATQLGIEIVTPESIQS